MSETNWRAECARLHIELDIVRAEMEEWKIKFERSMLWKEVPRMPVLGRYTTLDCVGGVEGKATFQKYVAMRITEGDDGR